MRQLQIRSDPPIALLRVARSYISSWSVFGSGNQSVSPGLAVSVVPRSMVSKWSVMN